MIKKDCEGYSLIPAARETSAFDRADEEARTFQAFAAA